MSLVKVYCDIFDTYKQDFVGAATSVTIPVSYEDSPVPFTSNGPTIYWKDENIYLCGNIIKLTNNNKSFYSSKKRLFSFDLYIGSISISISNPNSSLNSVQLIIVSDPTNNSTQVASIILPMTGSNTSVSNVRVEGKIVIGKTPSTLLCTVSGNYVPQEEEEGEKKDPVDNVVCNFSNINILFTQLCN